MTVASSVAPDVVSWSSTLPEIDGVIEVPADLAVGEFHHVVVESALGPDLVADRVRVEAD